MKKMISFLLVLVLAILPLGALAAKGDANLGRNMEEEYNDNIYGACAVGDTLYINGYNGMYVYRVGDEDLKPLEYAQPESAENENTHMERIFSDGERIYALISTYDMADVYTLARAELCEVTLDGDKVNFGERWQVDISELSVNYGDGSDYLIQINSICCSGGRAYLSVYDEMGMAKIYVLDVESGEGMFIEDLEEPQACTPWKDGQLLIETYDYNSQSCAFYLYDPESESLTPACDPVDAEQIYRGLAYSAESDRLFYLSDGYLMAVRDLDFENAEPVSELSLAYYSDSAALLLPGDYYVYCYYEVVCVRSTNPEEMPETRLTLMNSGYYASVIEAYYDFGNTHGDVAVILSTEYQEDSKIIESMMNREAAGDIYFLSVQSRAYDALFERGYMVEMDDEAISTAVKGMYPGIREMLMRDGEVVAVPVSAYGWTLGVNPEGFEKIGISEEEIPTNWPEFLDLLAELPDLLPEDGSVRVFDDYYTQSSTRENLVSLALESYRHYLFAEGGDPSFDTPELRSILEKIMALDYEALGLKEDDEDEDEAMVRSVVIGAPEGERTYTLLESGVGCTIGNFYSDCTPWPLSVVPGGTPRIPLELTVAFINPFSEHVQEAQEFLATVLDNLEISLQYNLSDALNEPVRNRYYEKNVAKMQKQLDEAREALEKAEPVDKPVYEETVAQIERAMEGMEAYSWDISAESIEWYRTHAENIVVQQYDYLQDAEGLSDTAAQFLAGKIDVSAFLKGIDQKVRMMALEGN